MGSNTSLHNGYISSHLDKYMYINLINLFIYDVMYISRAILFCIQRTEASDFTNMLNCTKRSWDEFSIVDIVDIV